MRWDDYDLVKTSYHLGFANLLDQGVGPNPLILARLGCVVGAGPDDDGMAFSPTERDLLIGIQPVLNERSHCLALLTARERALWQEQFGADKPVSLIPTGVDRTIPPPGNNPYAEFSEKIAVYVGNLRGGRVPYPRALLANGSGESEIVGQQNINTAWQDRLNSLGRELRNKGIRLCFVGYGDVSRLEPRYVTVLGPIENERVWDYHFFADVGIALAQGRRQLSECSKLYYYLRTGLPAVSEEPIPNNDLIEETNLGFVADHGDDAAMAEMVEDAAHRSWDAAAAMDWMVQHHTWDERVERYDDMIRTTLNLADRELTKVT